MSYHLEITSGPDQGATYELPTRGYAVIGRAGTAELNLALIDSAVSGRHFRVLDAGSDGVWAEDLGSANGTLVNNRSISRPYRLEVGDTIEVGRTTLILRAGSPPAEVVPSLTIEEEDWREIPPLPRPSAEPEIPAWLRAFEEEGPGPADLGQVAPILVPPPPEPVPAPPAPEAEVEEKKASPLMVIAAIILASIATLSCGTLAAVAVHLFGG